MEIGTWNVRTPIRDGASADYNSALLKYRIDTAALQEVRRKGTGILKLRHNKPFNSGNMIWNTLGTAFVVQNNLLNNVLAFESINVFMCTLRVRD